MFRRVLTMFVAFILVFSYSAVAYAEDDDLELLPSDGYQTATSRVMSIWIAKLTLKMLY